MHICGTGRGPRKTGLLCAAVTVTKAQVVHSFCHGSEVIPGRISPPTAFEISGPDLVNIVRRTRRLASAAQAAYRIYWLDMITDCSNQTPEDCPQPTFVFDENLSHEQNARALFLSLVEYQHKLTCMVYVESHVCVPTPTSRALHGSLRALNPYWHSLLCAVEVLVRQQGGRVPQVAHRHTHQCHNRTNTRLQGFPITRCLTERVLAEAQNLALSLL